MRLRYALLAIAAASVVLIAVLAREDTTPDGVPAASFAPLLGVAHDDRARWLVRVAPVSLLPLPDRRLRLDAPIEAWALSPDGSWLAAVTDRAGVLRLLDVEHMRPLGRLRTRARGALAAVVWPRPDRLWIVLARPSCCALGSTTVVTVDPIARRVIARRRLAAGLVRVAASPDGPVLLLAPSGVIGPATLATVDASGAVEQLPLEGLAAGAMPTEAVPFVEHVRSPALAVDPGRRRAYVVASRPHAVEIDLRRQRVHNHRLEPRTSLLDRLRELLEPAAAASSEVGPVRSAEWIDAAHIAISGYDAHIVWRGDGNVDAGSRPAGLRVIDTRDWSVRTLDEEATAFDVAAGLLLIRGPSGRGLAAYSPDGRRRFHVLDDRPVEIVATSGSLAYVRTPPDRSLHVVDVARGRVVGRSAPGRARLLPESAPAGWD